MKNLLQLYAVFISAVCTVVLIISLGLMSNRLLDALFVEVRFSWELSKYSTDEAYLKYKASESNSADLIDKNEQSTKEKFSSKQSDSITEERLSKRQEYIDDRKNSLFIDIIGNLIWMIISSLCLLLHWRLAKKYSVGY